jgi:squalene monooxygenase
MFMAFSRWLTEITQLVVTMRVFSGDDTSTTTTTTTTAAATEHVEQTATCTTTSDPSSESTFEPEVIIVGCGVAGAALAATLGQDHRRVLVIERDLSEPDRIVGELLQPGGVAQLCALGLADCLEGIDAQAIKGYGIFHNDERVCLTYPRSTDDEALFGRSFHHGRFIMNLRRAAAKQQSVHIVEGTVNELLEDASGSVVGVQYRNKASGHTLQVRAPLVVVCDGLFSKFRSKVVGSSTMSSSSFVGLVLSDLQLPFPNHGHVILAKPSPVLLYPISSTEARILVDVPAPLPTDMRQHLLDVTAPQLPDQVRDAFVRQLQSGARLRSMPAARMHPEPYTKRGVILIGDAFNVRNPLTGGGMTVAFTDCNILRSILNDLHAPLTAEPVDRDRLHALFTKRFFAERRASVSIVNILAHALYEVFSATLDPVMVHMQQGCFQYFLLGGQCVAGPMSLLSCISDSPMSLIYHFFSVGFYSMAKTLLPFPTPARIYNSLKLGYFSAKILLPLLWHEHLLSPFYPRFPAATPTAVQQSSPAAVVPPKTDDIKVVA